jgi:NADP-dependent 3-hydroxy acid dehydrogenase YdfG
MAPPLPANFKRRVQDCPAVQERNLLNRLTHEWGDTRAYAYDALDTTVREKVFGKIKQELGPVDVLVYNAGAGMFGSVDEIKLSDFEAAWRINALGLLAAVKAVLPDMRAVGKGNIVVIGATASVKHGANFTAFTSAKAAQRALAQSIAKHVGPEGVHVSLVIIDGVIDLPRTREMLPNRADDFFLKPDDIAQSVFFLAQQPKSAWTFELDVRPFGEKW